MARTQSLQSADGIYATDDIGNIMMQVGSTVPSAVSGYGVGAIYIDNDASAGAQMWINEGTTSSCTFNQVLTEGGAFTFTGDNTFSGTNTFDDLIETDFNPYTRVFARSDFTKALTKASVASGSYWKSVMSFDPDWIVSGSGAGAVAGFTGAARSDGGAYLNNSSASSAYVFMKPAKSGRLGKINWSTSKAPRFRAVIQTGTAITANKFVMGLYSGSVRPARFIAGTNTKNRVEVFLDKVADSKLHVNAVASTVTSSSTSLAVTVAASTIYDIEIRVSTARIVTVYVNSTLVYTSTAALKAATRLVPIIGVQTEDAAGTTAANQGVTVYHTLLSQDITAT